MIQIGHVIIINIQTKKGKIKCDILIAATGYSLNIPNIE